MNDHQLTNSLIELSKSYANSSVSWLEIVCKDCKAKERCKREIQRCYISQAIMRMTSASRLLSEIIDRRKEGIG